MMKYLVILMDEEAVSFCHYKTPERHGIIPLDIVKKGMLYAMKENLSVQFVYSANKLPEPYLDLIESVDHVNIKPMLTKERADILVAESVSGFIGQEIFPESIYVVRTGKNAFFDEWRKLLPALKKIKRMNIVFTDEDKFSDKDAEIYKNVLDAFADELCLLYKDGFSPQVNVLTDRMMLAEMKNCNAGSESITLAPDGKFYVCPAFYASGLGNIGDTTSGLTMKNKQLYRLDHSPLCRRCDAYQCRRCLWQNLKFTNEICIPSHGQCLASHVERNASRRLLFLLKDAGVEMPVNDIPYVDYLDPIDSLNII